MEPNESKHSSLNSNVMRLLFASILLDKGLWRSFADELEKYSEARVYKATAPEIGLDINALLSFSRIIKDEEDRQKIVYTILGLGLLVAVFFWIFNALDTYPYYSYLGIQVYLCNIPAIVTLAAWGILSWVHYQTIQRQQYELTEIFKRENYSPASLVEKYAHIPNKDTRYQIGSREENLIIYGGFTPFVGAGINLGTWSFTIDLSKAKDSMIEQESVIPFTADELYATIQTMCTTSNEDGLVAQDYYFISGKNIRDKDKILPGIYSIPRQKLPVSVLDSYAKSDNSVMRRYKWIRHYSWGDEVVLSYFVYCTMKGNDLFVETNRYLLPPMDEKYHRIDRLPPLNSMRRFGLFLTASVLGPAQALKLAGKIAMNLDLGVLLGNIIQAANPDAEDKQRRREIENNPEYNYGASSSFREILNAQGFSDYFQLLDVQMNAKILEHRILDSIVEFLHQHNIDTSEIKERKNTILNSGVIVQGGNITAESLAVGTGSKAVTNRPLTHPEKEK